MDYNIVTLDAALQAVAERSFYEDTRIVPVVTVDAPDSPVGYIVEDDHAHASDDWTWTRAGGIADRDSVSETSRLMDATETYATAGHIRYNMAGAVGQLEAGVAVTFAYATVRDDDVTWDEATGGYVDADGCPADDLAGWILVAIWDDAD